MLVEMLQRNASKLTIFLEDENPHRFFRFSFRATLFYSQMNALIYANNRHRPGYSLGQKN